MNKKFLSMAAAAMMFAACSDDLKVDQAPEIATNPTEATAEQVPVMFGAYVNRATTRAGLSGTLTSGNTNWIDTDGDSTPDAWSGIEKSGFGVFAYYTDAELYNENFKPNFMYNQRVYNSNTDGTAINWTYEPVRYWPNEFGQGAVSDDVDRVSFFAYAPYVSTNASGSLNGNGSTYDEDLSSLNKTGIIGLSRNSVSGDPYVKYAVSMDPTNTVDLTYGVAGADINTATGTVSQGSALVDLTKPNINAKIPFDFKHALAQLNVQIDAAVDDMVPGIAIGNDGQNYIDGQDPSTTPDTKTRIYVRSISFEGLADKGMLNLREGAWYDMTGQPGVSGEVTLYDGRNDGREVVMAATNEGESALNPDIIQKDSYNGNPGVTATAKNLFNSTNVDASVLVIPTGVNMRVTIVYDVETADDLLPGYLSGSTQHGISVENAITQTLDIALAKGKKHTLKLHLGMTSVKFEASVSAWDDSSTTTSDLSLPGNVAGTLNALTTLIDGTKYADADDATARSNKDAEWDKIKSTYIGMFVDATGNISSAKSPTTIGQIAYMVRNVNENLTSGSRDEFVDESTVTDMSNYNILVMAVSDAKISDGSLVDQISFPWWNEGASSSQPTWGSLVTGSAAVDFSPQNMIPNDASLNIQGVQITTATAFTGATNNYSGYDITYQTRTDVTKDYAIYAAQQFKALETSTEGTPEITGASKWFLPTMGQMINMGAADWRSWGGTGYGDKSKTNGGPAINLSGYYWTASEYSATGAWGYFATGGYFYAYDKLAATLKVRPVFAF